MQIKFMNLEFQVKVYSIILILSMIMPHGLQAQTQSRTQPILGAEVYLEPGQTPEEVDHWVKVLSDSKMPFARVFMMWNYLEPKPDVWDFTLYDALFKSAEKFGVNITATLVPNSPPFFWGKDFFYITHNMHMYEKEEYRDRSIKYIQKVVERYKNSPALDSWWLYNEPSGNPHVDTFAIDEFKNWLKKKYMKIDALNESWQAFFNSFQDITYDNRWQQGGWVWQNAFYDWNNFWQEHVNNQIAWLRKEVEKVDSNHPFHTNPPGVFGSLAHYDLRGMKKSLNTLGSSLHPSWNFSFIPREKYALAVSWQNDLLYGVAEDMPYWISELQAGNNFNGSNPMGPSPADIAQWVWTSFASGARRVIFWLLNPRMQGNESNEWALLDFQQQPSARLKKAAEITKIIDNNKSEFIDNKPILSPITIIISPQTLLMQERKQDNSSAIDAVRALAHQKASMACYNALMQQGIPVQLKLNTEFDWGTTNKGQLVILADVRCLTSKDIEGIETFVRNGNKVIATGLTGLYDENEKSWVVNREFPLSNVFGGSFREIFMGAQNLQIELEEYRNAFPVQLWYSQILAETGKVVGRHNGVDIAVRNNYGQGSVLWIPSMLGLGAWVGNSIPFAELLRNEVSQAIKTIPFHFDSFHENCFMHTLKTSKGYVTVVVNASDSTQKINIIPIKKIKSKLLYGKGWDSKLDFLTIGARETAVMKWE